MVPVARRNLLAEKGRFLVAVGGVAFAVFLTLVVQSLYLGFRQSVSSLIQELPADLWVVQKGTFDLFHSTSVLPERLAEQVQGIEGVRSVWKVRGRQMSFQGGDRSGRTLILAFDTQGGGSAVAATLGLGVLPGPGEMVIGEVTSRESGLGPGDRVSVGGKELAIVGKAAGKAGLRGFSLINFDDAQSIFGMPGTIGYLLVSLTSPSQMRPVAQEIESRIAGIDAFTRDEFASSSAGDVDAFLPVVVVLMAVSFLVGAVVVSLTIYTATIEKARDYGVLKAIGASNSQLYRIVLSQSFVVSLLGFAAGLPLAVGASRLIERLVPEFITLFQWPAVLTVLAVVVAMGLMSASLPARRIARIDPAAVFRA